jgi:hypothetical protein
MPDVAHQPGTNVLVVGRKIAPRIQADGKSIDLVPRCALEG